MCAVVPHQPAPITAHLTVFMVIQKDRLALKSPKAGRAQLAPSCLSGTTPCQFSQFQLLVCFLPSHSITPEHCGPPFAPNPVRRCGGRRVRFGSHSNLSSPDRDNVISP